MKILTVNLPEKDVQYLRNLVFGGYEISISEAVRKAVHDFIHEYEAFRVKVNAPIEPIPMEITPLKEEKTVIIDGHVYQTRPTQER